MKKRIFAVLLAACTVMSLAACGSSSDDAASNDSANSAETTESGSGEGKVQTVTDGKLTVATSPDFAPYEFYAIDEDGNPTLSGFDMDLAQYIADYM